MVGTVAAGLTIRFARLGLPPEVVKWGGSTLWAVMIYWVVSTAFGSGRIVRNVILSGIIATAIEFLKLYDATWLDAFRRTLPGIILLGRIFTFRDIAAYWIAIVIVAVIECVALAQRQASLATGRDSD
jgi:hypothetical protein